jgi:type III pantothenate kinase
VGPGTKTGINIRIDNPSSLGADLLVGAVAAVDAVGYPCIVWDLGTATTVSVVDKDGAFRGGAIMPGINTALNSLTNNTSLLPQISVDAPDKVIGSNTISCLQSGAVYGNAAMMDGMNARIMEELGYEAPVVVTGGLGREIAPQCRSRVQYIGELLLDGLRLIYEKNKK